MALSLDILPWLVHGIVQLGLAALLLGLGLLRRASRAFVLFLVLMSASNILGALSRMAPGGTAEADYWWRVSPYFWLAMPFVLLQFLLVFPAPRARFFRTPFAAAPMVACVILVGVLYAVDHTLFWGEGVAAGGRAVGPLSSLLSVTLTPLLSFAAFVFARDFWRSAAPDRTAALMAAVAFGMEAALAATTVAVPRILRGGAQFLGETSAQDLSLVLWAGPFALLLVELARGLRRATGRERSSFRFALFAIGVTPLAMGISILAQIAHPEAFHWATFVSGLIDLAFVLLVSYALVRHRLFGIELRVKRSIKQATMLASAALLYIVVTLLTQSWWPVAVPYVGLVTVLLLVPAFPALRRVGQKVAEAAMPGVERSPEYFDARKLEVYRVALEDAMVEHDVLPESHERALTALRVKLGITDRDHAVLEHAARAARAGGAHRVTLAPGALILGRYRVERQFGEGGMARTYLADDQVGGKGKVVVKTLQPDRRGVEDLLREARAIASVQHPRVVRLLGVDHVAGEAFLVMEYLEGGSLADRLRRGPLATSEFRSVARDLLDALEAVHEAGLVHRDVKPSNVLLTREGTAKLGDFGVAHIQGFETTIGGVGQAVGTVRFMSPEQARGRPATPRSDLFSAAATLYETYTGEPYLPAKAGETAVELQIRAAQGNTFGRLVDGPPALSAWFVGALDPEPLHRFSSARVMRDALEAALVDVAAGTP